MNELIIIDLLFRWLIDRLIVVVQMQMSDSYLDKSELQKLKLELEARAQRELDAKLEEVNAYLIEQARARERLDKVRDANENELRKEFENMRKELLVRSGRFLQIINCLGNRKIVQQKLAYAGHVLRGSSGRNALVILEGKIRGKRAKGRARRMWFDDAKQWTVVKDYNEVKRNAEDREAWRAITRQPST